MIESRWHATAWLAVFMLFAALMHVVTAPDAEAAKPNFRLPFPCGQKWVANNTNSSAHAAEELDFNRGSTAYADKGHTVLAAAYGTVATAANQGTSNGYGNLVKIDHGDGWYTYYAHLNTMAVKAGQTVSKGQPIGSVGNTSYRSITPHLHYEIRYGSGYPGNIRAVPGYNYSAGGNQTLTSDNCRSQRDVRDICGPNYIVNDSQRLGGKGVVVLTWNSAKQNNCAVTLKFGNLSTRTSVSAYITPQGKAKKTDSGQFYEYAGPVRTDSPTCVKWGGTIESKSYTSPWEHC